MSWEESFELRRSQSHPEDGYYLSNQVSSSVTCQRRSFNFNSKALLYWVSWNQVLIGFSFTSDWPRELRESLDQWVGEIKQNQCNLVIVSKFNWKFLCRYLHGHEQRKELCKKLWVENAVDICPDGCHFDTRNGNLVKLEKENYCNRA